MGNAIRKKVKRRQEKSTIVRLNGYKDIKCAQIRQFLQNNSISTVFDLDDEPTDFELLVFGAQQLSILEIDSDMPDEAR